jgi:hypothetical protein
MLLAESNVPTLKNGHSFPATLIEGMAFLPKSSSGVQSGFSQSRSSEYLDLVRLPKGVSDLTANPGRYNSLRFVGDLE